MRYHTEKPDFYTSIYGTVYTCDHKVYDKCTLFEISEKGLAVIQQRYDPATKHTWWSDIDPWLTDIIYLHPKFKDFFDEHAGLPVKGIYPTVTVRQLMWGLRIKPLVKETWETCFDHKNI